MKFRNNCTLGVAAAMVASLSMLSSCGKGGDDAAAKMAAMQQQAPALAVQTIRPASIELESLYPATIKGRADVEVRPMISGNITSVNVEEGQHVSKGQVLFVIDRVPYEAAVAQAEAAVAQAQSGIATAQAGMAQAEGNLAQAQASVSAASASVETAQISVNSNQALRAKNIISEHSMQISRNQLTSARAQLTQAKAGLAQANAGISQARSQMAAAQAQKAQAEAALVQARKNLSYTSVTAPSSGVVGSIPVRVGTLASPSGQPLTTVSDNSQVYAYFSLTERQMLEMTDNGAKSLSSAIDALPPVRIKLANGEVYGKEGKVMTVSGLIDESTGASTVRAVFDNDNGLIRSGSSAQLIIPMDLTNAIVIPQKASGEIQGSRFVFTVDKNNVLHQTPIKVLANQDGKNFVVTEGLKPGDRIVTEGVGTTARDGITITPSKTPAQQQGANPAAAAQGK